MTSAPPPGTSCDRCFMQPRPATQRIRFVYKAKPYITNLCDEHGLMLDRDMTAWCRTASEVGMELASTAPPEELRRPVRIPEPQRRPARPQARPQPRRAEPEPFIVATGEVINLDGDAGALFPVPGEISQATLDVWAESFTDHALERMELRRVSKQDVWRTIQAPGKTRRCPAKSGGHPDTAKYTHAGIVVVVNERTHEIITVARVGDDLFSEAG